MKNTSLAVIGVGIALFIPSCAARHHAPGPGTNVYVYTFAKAPVLSSSDSQALIETFLNRRDVGSLYRSDDNTVYYASKDDVNENFEQNLTNGNFTFNRTTKAFMDDRAPRLPDRADAMKAAQEFLGRNKLLPKEIDQFRLVHYGGLRSSSVIDGRRAGPIVDRLVTLTYGRTLDDMAVIGPGSKVVVNVGDGGEVVGMIYRWRELDRESRRAVTPAEMISQQEAEELARRQIATEYGESTSYKILGAGTSYFDNNGRVLQPVYVFETAIRLQSPQVAPFNYLCVIPMLRSSPEPLNLTAVDPKAKQLITDPQRLEKGPQRKRASKRDGSE